MDLESASGSVFASAWIWYGKDFLTFWSLALSRCNYKAYFYLSHWSNSRCVVNYRTLSRFQRRNNVGRDMLE